MEAKKYYAMVHDISASRSLRTTICAQIKRGLGGGGGGVGDPPAHLSEAIVGCQLKQD